MISSISSEGVRVSTLKVLKPGGPAWVEDEGCEDDGMAVGAEEDSSAPLLRFLFPPLPGAGGSMLCWRRMCLARASERVKDLSHSREQSLKEAVVKINEIFLIEDGTRKVANSPGLGHVNGFSPVWDRICDIKANLEVCGSPRRGHVAHSHV